jgi:tripartite-type tricarboxylate transporter receptor subunit TctC
LGNIAAQNVATSPADGYSILFTPNSAPVANVHLFKKLPFDPVKDFTPVVMVAYSPHILAVHPSVPANNVKELIAYAKEHPGKLDFAVSGIGGANHLAGIDFAQRTGIKWAYIPYKGGSQAIADLMGGQAQVMFNGMLATYPMVKEGRLKAIAISSPKRFSAAPDLPTVAESGLPGFETGSWQGIVAPAHTPPELVKKLHAAVMKVLSTPEMKARLDQAGAEVRAMTPEQFGTFIANEKARWAKVVRESGEKFD